MSKNQFGAMIKALQQEGKFKFPSEEKLYRPPSLGTSKSSTSMHIHTNTRLEAMEEL